MTETLTCPTLYEIPDRGRLVLAESITPEMLAEGWSWASTALSVLAFPPEGMEWPAEARTLPEEIPTGEYAICGDDGGDSVVLRVWAEPEIGYAGGLGIGGISVRLWTYVTAEQVRHLLAMPGRPHDDRLDGPAAPEVEMVPWWKAKGRTYAPSGKEITAASDSKFGPQVLTAVWRWHDADADGMVPVLPEGDR